MTLTVTLRYGVRNHSPAEGLSLSTRISQGSGGGKPVGDGEPVPSYGRGRTVIAVIANSLDCTD